MRLTRRNPDKKTYRFPCVQDTEETRVDNGMGYPSIFGAKIDILGKLEDMHPLEWYLENETKK